MEQWITEIIDPYYLRILILMGINIIMVLGLNITTGVTGQLSLGHAGFMSLGAYTSAILTLELGIPFWLTLLAGAAVAAVFGFIIGLPALRRRAITWPWSPLALRRSSGCSFNFEPGARWTFGIPQQTTLAGSSDHRGDILTSACSSRIGKASYYTRKRDCC